MHNENRQKVAPIITTELADQILKQTLACKKIYGRTATKKAVLSELHLNL